MEVQKPTASRWQPSDYAWHPYQLTALSLNSEDEDLMPRQGSNTPLDSTDNPTLGVPRKPGRQRRTSIICQVRAAGSLPV
jgi:hypothetical protein